ncbi:MAG: hypothetical protein SGI74_01775 [Oligoflexia bacterium]|nr:hypothetical protein [Oligoflexia bacterium]
MIIVAIVPAVIAGMAWALENPNAGIVEADEMDFKRCSVARFSFCS